MKKFGKIFMIAAAAAMVLVSCKDPKNPTDQPTVNVAADPATLAVNATGNINLTLSAKAEKEITVALTASSDAITLKETSLKIAAGETTATTTFDAKKEGDVTVSVASADAKSGNPAAIKVTGDNPNPNPNEWKTYCEITFPDFAAYASLGWAKMGDTTIEGDETGNVYISKENVPLNSALSVEFLPYSSSNQTGATDPYSIIVFADWNNSGELKQIDKKDITAGTEASVQSFTLEIPTDAGEIGTIRVLSTLNDPDYGLGVDEEGCGTVESGNVFDILFVNKK